MFSLYFNETASSKWTGNHKKPCFPPESGIFIYWQLSFIFCFLCDEEPHASLPIPWSGDWVDIFESSLSPAVYHYLWIVVSFFFSVYTLMCPVCPTAYFSCENFHIYLYVSCLSNGLLLIWSFHASFHSSNCRWMNCFVPYLFFPGTLTWVSMVVIWFLMSIFPC